MLLVLLLVLSVVLLVAYHKHGCEDDEDGHELYPGEGNIEEEPGHDGGHYDTAREAEGHEDGVGAGRRRLDDECVIAVEDSRVDDTEKHGEPSTAEGEAREDEGYHRYDDTADNCEDRGGEALVTGIVVGVKSGEE